MDLPAGIWMRLASRVPSSGQQSTSTATNPHESIHALWVSWNVHRRTTGLCAAWDVPLHVIRSKRKGLRWIEQAVDTLKLLHRRKPSILFVQNPSLSLTVLAMLARRVFGYCLVVDGHNEGVRPFHRPGVFVAWLTRRVLKNSDMTIVTNAALAEDVIAAGGRPVVLPDSLPVPLLVPKPRAWKNAPDVAVIASFRSDEPIAAILAAAATMPEIRFVFSGDARRFRKKVIDLPPNVYFPGYLVENNYWQLLAQARVICDLNLKSDCLVCGAYEGLALGKPLVLSENPPTREIFGRVAVLTSNQPEDIANALRTALKQCEQLAANAVKEREAFRARWHLQSAEAWDCIHTRASAANRGWT
jgi:glycosyltransferase involved in cell wall biosynthesis